MKREAWNHPKFLLLKRDLGQPMYCIVGILEAIWLVTGDKLPAGDIGRWSNEEIAAAIDYPGDADQLIAALVKRRLLDRIPDEDGRLYIHDWHEHCDRYVNLRLLKSGRNYANGMPARTKEREESPEAHQGTRKNTKQRESAPKSATNASCARPMPEPVPEPVPVPVPERAGVVVTQPENPPARPSPQSGFHATLEAVRCYFPGADDEIAQRILEACRKLDPELTDGECAIWCHGCYPEGGVKRSRGPGWFLHVVPEELQKRPQDVRLLREFIAGHYDPREAQHIIADGIADWRVRRALKAWLYQQQEVAG